MTSEEMEKAIEFILSQDAAFSAKLQILEEKMASLTEKTDRMAVEAAEDRRIMREGFAETRESFVEVRGAITKLLDTIEDTQDFAKKVARLAIASEKRLAKLESGPS